MTREKDEKNVTTIYRLQRSEWLQADPGAWNKDLRK